MGMVYTLVKSNKIICEAATKVQDTARRTQLGTVENAQHLIQMDMYSGGADHLQFRTDKCTVPYYADIRTESGTVVL